MIVPYSDSSAKIERVLAIKFSDLVLEQNAWVNYLQNSGVRRGDATVVALPFGPAFVAVNYALFRIGAHVCAVDSEFDWKVGHARLRDFDPQHIVGTRSSLSSARVLAAGNEGEVSFIEIEKPQALTGSVVRSFQTRFVGCDPNESSLTIMRTVGQSCTSAFFNQDQLCKLASHYRLWFDLNDGDRGLPGNILEALIFPAAGLASLVVTDRFSDGSPFVTKQILEAVACLDLRFVSGETRFWRSLARLSCRESLPSGSSFEAIVHGSDYATCGLALLSAALPELRFQLVFGSPCFPFVSCMEWSESNLREDSAEFRGIYRGNPLSGLQLSLLPAKTVRWTDEPNAATALGEIAIAREDYAPLGDPNSWEGTGELGFFDTSGALWHCGSRMDVLTTGFGGFCPVRCEAVFNRHPRVQRSVLFALRKGGKTRPGLVVETAVGDIPKRGVEESRFKAELIQLAADFEETSIILDIFFSDRLPLEDGALEVVDRKRVSKEYSRRVRF